MTHKDPVVNNQHNGMASPDEGRPHRVRYVESEALLVKLGSLANHVSFNSGIMLT